MNDFRETHRAEGPPSGGPSGRREPREPWESPGVEEGYGEDWAAPPPPRGGRFDLAPLFVLLDALRGALPAELRAQFTALLREVLLTLRSLIDWYLERLDHGRREPTVERIPVD
jgi:hypothetical protein